MFASILQFFKLLILGHTPQGIRARTILAVCTTIAVLIIEVAAYSYYWDEITDMIRFDYDFNGVPNDIAEKKFIWYNLVLQIFVCIFVFILKPLLYRIKRVQSLLRDNDGSKISLVDKRCTLFAWELSMLFVTTEQGYVFDLVDVIESPMCDDIVSAIFVFWLIVLVAEFFSDLKKLKNSDSVSEPSSSQG